MNNYEYIIACLPVLSPGWKYPEGKGFSHILEEIRNQLSASDSKVVDLLLQGLDPETLYRREDTGERMTGAALMYGGLSFPQAQGNYPAAQVHLTAEQ